MSQRVDSVKEENLKLRSENQVLGQYIENLMSASSVFQSTSPKTKKKWTNWFVAFLITTFPLLELTTCKHRVWLVNCHASLHQLFVFYVKLCFLNLFTVLGILHLSLQKSTFNKFFFCIMHYEQPKTAKCCSYWHFELLTIIMLGRFLVFSEITWLRVCFYNYLMISCVYKVMILRNLWEVWVTGLNLPIWRRALLLIFVAGIYRGDICRIIVKFQLG